MILFSVSRSGEFQRAWSTEARESGSTSLRVIHESPVSLRLTDQIASRWLLHDFRSHCSYIRHASLVLWFLNLGVSRPRSVIMGNDHASLDTCRHQSYVRQVELAECDCAGFADRGLSDGLDAGGGESGMCVSVEEVTRHAQLPISGIDESDHDTDRRRLPGQILWVGDRRRPGPRLDRRSLGHSTSYSAGVIPRT